MDTSRILNNGISIPTVGFGTYLIDDGEPTVRAVTLALQAGYRHIDTAAAYENEKSVGKAVRESGIPRKEIFITTKLWNEDVRQGKTEQAFKNSLSLLDSEYIDLYLIHWPADGFVDAWLAMEEIYKSGKVKAIGISNFQQHHIETLMKQAAVTPAVNQIECHPYLSQKALREFCNDRSILCESWSPLGGKGGNLLQDAILADIANKRGKTPAQIVLRWIVQLGMAVNPKSEHEQRIKENLDVFDFTLDDAAMQAINSLNKDKRFGPDPDHFNF